MNKCGDCKFFRKTGNRHGIDHGMCEAVHYYKKVYAIYSCDKDDENGELLFRQVEK